MATINYLLQGKAENANIYLRFSVARNQDYKRKTGFTIHRKDWSEPKKQPKLRDEDLKNLKIKLDSLKTFVERSYNDKVSEGSLITANWLQTTINNFNNATHVIHLDYLENYIEYIIETSGTRVNQKGGVGLSARRKAGYKTFLGMIKRYQKEALNGDRILIRSIDLNFVNSFKSWLVSQGYSINYIGKNIDNLKAVCNDAEKNNIETSSQLKNIRSFSEKKEAEAILILSDKEQLKIENATILREALQNARKWLLLGCQIGQRGSDLLRLADSNIKTINKVKVIELTQQKTGKEIVVPLTPKALEIIQNGFPYSIALQNFNDYIKAICKIAEIDQPTKGSIREKGNKIKVKGTYPKYKLLGSHVCRRSFATNYYSKIPTSILKNITGHSTEKMFLKYIGKSSYDSALQMAEYFNYEAETKNNKESFVALQKV